MNRSEVENNPNLERQLNKLTILLALLVVLFASTSWFLASEMMKKFNFFNQFAESSHHLVEFSYGGQETPGMRNIVLRSEDGRPFTTLVGFYLEVPKIGAGFDYYGYVESGSDGVAVVSTYIGRDLVTFQFFVNRDVQIKPVKVSSTDADQKFNPNVVFPPHWWQRLGFYS
ncbi:MAG: hypothetical protein WA057_06345 [Candidatus Magasanikiibacteriota bacterium]